MPNLQFKTAKLDILWVTFTSKTRISNFAKDMNQNVLWLQTSRQHSSPVACAYTRTNGYDMRKGFKNTFENTKKDYQNQ